MADYAENGLSLRWDDAAEAAAGALAGTRRVRVALAPAHPANALRALCAMDGGPLREVRGFAEGRDAASGAQLFALDLPEPPPGQRLQWWPIASCSGREADPRRGNLPPAVIRTDAAPTPPPAPPLPARPRFAFLPELLFHASVPLTPDPDPVGETPDGLRLDFALGEGGRVEGPALHGIVEHRGGDWLRIRPDGVGICNIHAVIKPSEGGVVMTEYGGVVDFGPDGYRAVAAGRGPRRAPLRLTPRYLTGEPRLAWLNRLQCVAIGEVNLDQLLVRYDCYALRQVPG